MDHFYDFSGRLSRKIVQNASIHQLSALAKFSPRLPGFPTIQSLRAFRRAAYEDGFLLDFGAFFLPK